MNRVEPIRDIDKFYDMQAAMIRDGRVKECLLVIFMFNTNLRVSDALLIKWRDLINDEGEVVDNLVISEKKTSHRKWIPLPGQLKEVIMNFYIKYNPRRSSFVFRSLSNRVQGRNQHWTRKYVCEFIQDYAKKVGVKDPIGSHSMRKTWGWHAYNSLGIDVFEISRILGHKDVRTTEVYCGIDSDRIRDQYEEVSKLNKRATKLLDVSVLPGEVDIEKRGDKKKERPV